MNRTIVIFFVILLIFFAGIVFFRFNNRSTNNFIQEPGNSTVIINSATYRVELARTQKEQVDGLSGREGLLEGTGMLFIFDKPSYYSFWMRGMKFPLDIIFISDKKVVDVYENLQPTTQSDNNPPIYGSDVISDSVLEINAGEAAKNNIKVGDNVIVEIN